jgi:hypothetical protein
MNRGLTVSAAHSGPLPFLPEASYNFIGATYELGSFGHVGLSIYRFDYGEDFLTIVRGPDGRPVPVGRYTPATTLFRLTFAKAVLKNLYTGVNIALLRDKLLETASLMQFDLGLLKILELNTRQRISFGASLFNVNHGKLSYTADTQKAALPVILNVGGSWQIATGRTTLNTFDLNTLSFIVHLEYQYLLNSDYYDGFKAGGELGLIDMIFLRMGTYYQDVDDHGLPESNKSSIGDFTYGLGVRLPLGKLLSMENIPEVQLDVTSLKQPSLVQSFNDWDNFSVYSLSVNWNFQN